VVLPHGRWRGGTAQWPVRLDPSARFRCRPVFWLVHTDSSRADGADFRSRLTDEHASSRESLFFQDPADDRYAGNIGPPCVALALFRRVFTWVEYSCSSFCSSMPCTHPSCAAPCGLCLSRVDALHERPRRCRSGACDGCGRRARTASPRVSAAGAARGLPEAHGLVADRCRPGALSALTARRPLDSKRRDRSAAPRVSVTGAAVRPEAFLWRLAGSWRLGAPVLDSHALTPRMP